MAVVNVCVKLPFINDRLTNFIPLNIKVDEVPLVFVKNDILTHMFTTAITVPDGALVEMQFWVRLFIYLVDTFHFLLTCSNCRLVEVFFV